jgi:hypothetical protein
MSTEKKPRLKPCKKCGGKNISLWDCGYSSFNPGGGNCNDCGNEVTGESGCSPTQTDLAAIWNKGQTLTVEESLRAENKRLRAKVKALKEDLKLRREGIVRIS